MQLDWSSLRELADRTEPGVAETWRPLMLAMLGVLEQLPLPAAGAAVVDVAVEQWRRDLVDPAALEAARVSVWQYLEDKNGETSTIADAEDRGLRDLLCVLYPPGSTETACDHVDFFVEVLRPVA